MKYSKKERTQKEIIQAAKAIIHEKGHEAVTVRYLAEITGYSYTNLYYYFKDLNALLWALRIDMIEDMIAELTSVSYDREDAEKEIIDAFYHYTDYFFRHPNVFRFFYFSRLTQPDGDSRYHALEKRFEGMWQTSFSRLVQEDVVQPEDIEMAAKTIIFALQGMIMLSLSSNGKMQQEDIKEELANLINFLLKNKKNN
jgi:AcrR family transcriptional regulator